MIELTLAALERRVQESETEVRRLRLVEAQSAGKDARIRALEVRARLARLLQNETSFDSSCPIMMVDS